MSEKLTDFCVEESVIDSLHREIANLSLVYYKGFGGDQSELEKLFKVLMERKQRYLTKRTMMVRRYGLKITVEEGNDLKCLDSYVTELTIAEGKANDITEWNISNMTYLRVLRVQDRCLCGLDCFIISKMPNLVSIVIGSNSFTKSRKRGGNNASRSFSITSCEKLETISIGRFSFSDYAGGFVLKDCLSLKTLTIGTVGSPSCNFYSSNCFISSNSSGCILIIDCKSLVQIDLGDEVFCNCRNCTLDSMVFVMVMMIDLQRLSQIRLGEAALKGRMNSASVTLNSSLYCI